MKSELLAECVQRYEDADKRVRALMPSVSASQANWRPTPKKWSINQCLEHLNRGLEQYIEIMAPRIESARQAGANVDEPTGKGPLGGRMIIHFLRKDPAKNHFKAPSTFKPTQDNYDKEKQVSRFLELNARLRELAGQADGLALKRIRFGSPVSFLIRFNLAQAFELHAVHHHRHIDQLERLINHPDFPKE